MSNGGAKPMKPKSFDVNNIKFSPLKTLDNGGKSIWINYDNDPVFLQTPEFEIPFDSGTFYGENGTGKYAVKVSLKNFEENPSMKAFHDKIVELDDKLKNCAIDNSVAWFKKKNMSMDTIESLYTHMGKVSLDAETGEPNGRYPPSFTFKVVKRDNKVLCKCFDSDKKEMNIDDREADDYKNLDDMFKKGTKVKMVLRCNGIWIASGKFGCTWRAEQIKITPAMGFNDYAFLEDSDEEGVEPIEGNFVDTSDDDDNT